MDGDRCPVCFSDDLMRFMPGVGVEWDLDWAISEIIAKELTPVDLDSEFEELAKLFPCLPRGQN